MRRFLGVDDQKRFRRIDALAALGFARRPLASAVLALAVILGTASASARTSTNVDYTKQQTFSGALRYLRIELGYPVGERDSDAAYLMFDYLPPGQKTAIHGAIEVVSVGSKVRLVVSIPKMPSYHEVVLRDALLQRLREDYGGPAEDERPAQKPANEQDRGKNRDEDRGKDRDQDRDEDSSEPPARDRADDESAGER